MKIISIFHFSLLLLLNINHHQLTFSESFLSLHNNDNNYFKDMEILTTDLLYKIKPENCYTIITDSIYQAILQSNFFNRIYQSTFIIIYIIDSEDMQTPNYNTIQSLLEARKSNCQTYLIYLANGIQTERFLRFIDLHRILDTRSKFILLYDYHLFTKKLNYIWKRLINVLFIRQYLNSYRHNTSTGIWFDLNTVPFPIPIKSVLITKQINSWRSNRYRYGDDHRRFFSDKTLNLKGQPMNIVILKHTPAVFSKSLSSPPSNSNITSSQIITSTTNSATEQNYIIENQKIYSGLEIEIIKIIAKNMNFSIRFYETADTDIEKWGRLQLNGTFTGLLGEMLNGKADFALADLYYTPYNLEKMDLSIPYTTQCLTFLTPESSTDNSWQTLILPFSSTLWICVLFFLFCVGFVFYILSKIHVTIQKNYPSVASAVKPNVSNRCSRIIKSRTTKDNQFLTKNDKKSLKIKIIFNNKQQFRKKNKKKSASTRDIFDTFGNCIFYTLSMLLYVSLPRFPRGWPIRLLTGWYWIYCILVVVSYRASLTAILANPAPKLTIDTLKQLADSNIVCGAWGEQNRNFFLTSLDEVGQAIGTKLEDVIDVTEAIKLVAQGKYAYYENEYNLKEIRSGRESKKERETLHIMKECAIHMPISIGLEKNSPMKPRIDTLLRRIIESGLINKWLSDSIGKFQSNIEIELEQQKQQDAIMDLKKMYGAFVALGLGYLLAFIILLIEMVYWKMFIVNKHPLYDKYALYKLYQK